MDQGLFKSGGGITGGLFKHDQKGPDNSKDVAELSNVVRDSMRRVRILEERYSNLRRVMHVNEQNTLKDSKKFYIEIKSLNAEITELKKLIRNIGDELRLIVSDLKESVKKDELKVFENYLNLWEPMNFVSHKEVESIVHKILDSRNKKPEYHEHDNE